jgi:di/tricarboxylate transporter
MMPLEALLVALIVVAVLAALILTRVAPEALFLTALTLLLVTGVLSPAEGLSGFANEGVVTVAVLYVVVAGLRETGGVQRISRLLLGSPRTLLGAQVRVTTPVAFFSAFLNNTPIVAMLIPAVRDLATKAKLPPSKLLIPLSYAAMLGGMCTLVGTSPTLVAHGLLIERRGSGLGFFEIASVGVPVAVVGLAFLVGASRWLLPDRRKEVALFGDPREYTVEMTVDGDGPLVGKSVLESRIAEEYGLQLIEIHRDGEFYPVVSPHQRMMGGDRLVLAGAVGSVVDLQRRQGLTPASDQVFKLDAPRSDRILVEAVVSDSSPLVGRSIRRGRFRTRYGAVVIAVARNGVRVGGNLRDIILRPGDTLLLEATPAFAERHQHSRDFFLVSTLPDSHPLRFDRAALSLVILGVMVAAAALGLLSMMQAALLAAVAMVATRCLTVDAARSSIDWQVILVIAASIGVGRAMESSGLASILATQVMGAVGVAPLPSLIALYLLTSLFSEVVTNNAAVVLMFPIAVSLAAGLGVDVMPFVIAIVMAAAGAVATPIGYQTNLMVYGPGGYVFTDFLRAGLPLVAVTALVALLVIPRVWPF